jgi:hypothetical protein
MHRRSHSHFGEEFAICILLRHGMLGSMMVYRLRFIVHHQFRLGPKEAIDDTTKSKRTAPYHLRWDESCVITYVLNEFWPLRCVVVMH